MSASRAQPLNGGYDQSLLAETPEVSKAAKQEGYNVTLLDEPRPMRATSTPRSDPQPVVPKEYYHSLGPDVGARAKVPFWRTRGGMISLAILAIIIVGAVVGGAVGGTVGKSSSNKEAATKSSTSTQASQNTQSAQPTQAAQPTQPSQPQTPTSSVPSPTPTLSTTTPSQSTTTTSPGGG